MERKEAKEAIDRSYVAQREGFLLKRTSWELPSDPSSLEPARKRQATICNLFVNHRLPLGDIAHLLEENYGNVVAVLIGEQLIHERRKSSRDSTKQKSEGRPEGKWFYTKLSSG